MVQLFGWQIGRREVTKTESANTPALVLPQKDLEDGAITITQGAYYGTYVDLEGSVRNELELISRYREMALHPECASAINEIVTEAITQDTDDGDIVNINLDKLKVADNIKKSITQEFDTVKQMLNFNKLADELFRRWYVDGRMFYQIILDTDKPKDGIKELRFIDPRKIRKVREVMKDKDKTTGAEIIKSTSEYYVYNEYGLTAQSYTASVNQGIRIAPDTIINITSGILDAKSTMVISWLHKAIKALNQLRMIEDAIVIYRLSRAPERRIFYIDVGNLPKLKAEQYLKDIMVKYRNKLVYDSATGEVRDERKHLSMLEDFWLPRREGGRGTEIQTLPGGQNLGQLEDVIYFQKKLYKSLDVPIGRLDAENAGGGIFGVGRVAEITRDEVKFFKFIARLRAKFSELFNAAMRVQLTTKGICTLEEWDTFKESISYKFVTDSHFTELRDMEMLKERVGMLQLIEPYLGKYYSMEWVQKNVLQRTDEEIKEMRKQMDDEISQGLIPEPGSVDAQGNPIGQPGQPGMEQMPGQGPFAEEPPQPQQQQPSSNGKPSSNASKTPGLDSHMDTVLKSYTSSKVKKR